MNYDALHNGYVTRCEAAISQAVERQFRRGSKVSEAAAYSLQNGGKRVRGVLVLAVCDFFGGPLEGAEPLAAAVEMVHSFSLIHDDLPCMDDDSMRRGKPANHLVYGEAVALLAGDMLAIEALRCAAGAPLAPAQRLQAVEALATAAGANGMIYGQELDMAAEADGIQNEKQLETIQQHKTGALIVSAAQLGGIAAGANANNMASIVLYAQNIGRVFQMVDDLLDESGSAALLGKPVGSDRKNKKTTVVSLLGAEQARAEARTLTQRATSAVQMIDPARAEFLCTYANRLLERTS